MKLKITVHGVAYEVDVEVLDANGEMQGAAAPLPDVPQAAAQAPVPAAPLAAPLAAAGPAAAQGPVPAGAVASPIAGTVLEVKCRPGQAVAKAADLLVIEAMKMETTIAAPAAGTVKAVLVAAGDAVREGQPLVEIV